MKVIIFGTGNYYKDRKEKLKQFSNIQIIAFADNNSELWKRKIDNIEIIPPDSINYLTYDKVLIMSTYVAEIFDQLIRLNIKKNKVVTWEQLYTETLQRELEIYSSESIFVQDRDKVLMISTSLDYNGGSLAAVYGAMALKDRGIRVVLMAPGGDSDFIRETVECGVTVAISPALPYIYEKAKEFIEQFDVVLVNVFQMILCAQKVCKIRPVLWWIHEASTMYPPVIMRYPGHINEKGLESINILAVSRKAQENFNKFFHGRIRKTLSYGIPDMSKNFSIERRSGRRIVFAVIGSIIKLKAQDIFLNAITEMRDIRRAEFWIIGGAPDSSYYEEIKNMAEKINVVKLMGEMTRKEIYKAFSEIDVVVCTSKEEMLSIVITEGMMFGKVCIANDNTGNMDYIEHGVNGFVVPQGDVRLLAVQMQEILDNFDKLDDVRIQARKTYEKIFSMEIFGKNLEAALLETREKSINLNL